MPEVSEPSSQISRDLLDHLLQADAAGSPGLFPNPFLEASDGLGGDPPPRFSFTRETESEKLSLPWSGHGALRLVDLELEAVRDQRKTGKARRTPVGDGRIGNQFWLVAEHGTKAGYVRNIERDPHVRLKLRQGLRYRWPRALRTCSLKIIRVSGNAGWRRICLAAPGMRERCDSLGRNSSPFELIWIPNLVKICAGTYD